VVVTTLRRRTNNEAAIQTTSQKISTLLIDATNIIQVKAIPLYILTTIILSKLDKIGPYSDELILLDLSAILLVGIASVVLV